MVVHLRVVEVVSGITLGVVAVLSMRMQTVVWGERVLRSWLPVATTVVQMVFSGSIFNRIRCLVPGGILLVTV